ncbi:hypothetical protein BMS3Abin05_00266 [bacterium BMS3Abin05]|nr:hypothetical protein BMS3Abin05_00266 [bacterium BMS3Abin05]GBE27686.1 hypothetical protein BMS3Bbin03_01615 [bacterium BMS3Bbin03]HDZ11999.1 nickel pincer cofactor biosynthesis protein LarC [Bacteroidota bacterium]
MRAAYFDCFAGVSGDMILGALIDAGLDPALLEAELGKLNVSGYTLKTEKAIRKGLSGIKFSVVTAKQDKKRNLNDICEIIEESDLEADIKDSGRKIFEQLAAVEAKIHNKKIESIHFHEVGALDSIIDVLGSLIGLKKLGIEAVYSSKMHVGTGFVKCQHGTIPVPAPATLELLKEIPIYSRGIEAELTTPTGAAILKTVAKGFGIMPEMRVKKIGYGAGSGDLEIPNLLRIYIGETCAEKYEENEIILIETNIDDMSPEFFDHVSVLLLGKGSLDVFMTPVFMKKNRPGILLSVLTAPDKLDEILTTLFTETTTFGVRIHRLERKILPREVISVGTKFGEINVKIGRIGKEIKTISPEYEDCREIALKRGISLKDIYHEAKEAARKHLLQEKKIN